MSKFHTDSEQIRDVSMPHTPDQKRKAAYIPFHGRVAVDTDKSIISMPEKSDHSSLMAKTVDKKK